MVKSTGVKITEEQHAELVKLQAEVKSTPVARVAGLWLHEEALELFKCRVDEMAQENGLPAPGKVDGEVNHYGVDSKAREFTTYEPDTETT